MTLLIALLGIVATALVGAAMAAPAWRRVPRLPGDRALLAGTAYPFGALLVAAWMHALALIGLPASTLLAMAPIVIGVALIAWIVVRYRRVAAASDVAGAIAGNMLDARERWWWRALVAWLALRFAMLAIEVVSRPPLPWEAWLHAAGHAHVWLALRTPGQFVGEASWWTGAGYLAGLATGSPLTPALDAWMLFAFGRMDDTVVHAPWLALLVSQAALVYGAMRHGGATPLPALAGAAFVATLPLPNAHAALGGTGAMLVATYYLAAFSLAWRWLHAPAAGVIALILVMAVGIVAAGGWAGIAWCATLLPFAAAHLEPSLRRKSFAAMLGIAVLAVVVLAQNRWPAVLDYPAPGLGALVQHVFLLGNWHILPYAALAFAILVAPRRDAAADWLPVSTAIALALLCTIAFATSPAAARLFGATGPVGQMAMPAAVVLALWTARLASALWTRR